LTKSGKGRVIPHKRGGVYVYVPAEVAGDTAFPFKEGRDVSVYVQDRRLIVEERRGEAGYSEEAEKNRGTYLKLREDLVRDHPGKVAVIAGGRLVCVADSLEEAVKRADEEAPEARHRILWKIGEDEGRRVRRIGGTWLRRLG